MHRKIYEYQKYAHKNSNNVLKKLLDFMCILLVYFHIFYYCAAFSRSSRNI